MHVAMSCQPAACLPVPTELHLVLLLPSSSDGSGYIFRVDGPIYCAIWECFLLPRSLYSGLVEKLLRLTWLYDINLL